MASQRGFTGRSHPQSPPESSSSSMSGSTKATSVAASCEANHQDKDDAAQAYPDTPRLPSSLAKKPAGDSSTPQRPGSSRFESLNELLQKAGFKDTRVITPQSKTFGDMASNLNTSVRSFSGGKVDSKTQCSDDGPDSPTLNARAASEAGRRGGGGWFGWWGQNHGEASTSSDVATPKAEPAALPAGGNDDATPAATPSKTARLVRHARQQSSIHDSPRSPRGTRTFPVASPSKRRIFIPATSPAKKAASTNTLWKGSLAFRRSKANLKEAAASAAGATPALKTKTSLGHLRGGGHAAAVGVGISTFDGGKALGSLRKSPSERGKRKLDAASVKALESPTRAPFRATVDEWRRSLADITTTVVSIDDAEEEDEDDVTSPPRFIPKAAPSAAVVSSDLFASVATPLVSSEAAVAPRNSECFQGPERRGLRHARSVEALKAAMEAKREKGRPALKGRHSIIGQQSARDDVIPPVPALPPQHAASTIVSSLPSDPSIASQSLFDSPVRTTYQAEDAAVISPPQPPTPQPPVLTLTSPTGVHSPQFINLSGKEYDAHTFSPTDGRMLINDGPLPQALRNLSGRDRPGKPTRGRRMSASAGSSGSSSSSADLLDKPKRTRRGCRGGRKHKPGGTESPTQRLLRKSASVGVLAGVSDTQALRRTAAARANSGGRQSPMMSFGAAMAGHEEDDPFMAHVSKQEAGKAHSRGIADILASRDEENEASENAPGPPASAQRGVRTTASTGSLRGRIVSRPSSSRGGGAGGGGGGRRGSMDSPVKAMVARRGGKVAVVRQ